MGRKRRVQVADGSAGERGRLVFIAIKDVKILLTITCVLLCFVLDARAQSNVAGLPQGAVVVERRKIPSTRHRNREFVLWMVSPKKNPNGYRRDEPYTCPDQSRGSYYSGPTRVSLVDSATGRIINTLKITQGYGEDETDSFDVPYAIRKGYYYRVGAVTRNGVEAKPTVMWLRDYNGDGKTLEFALLDAVACMGLDTTLVGYSERQDRAIQYPVQLEVIEGARHSTRVSPWADYLLSKKPERPGYWKYEIDYRGRGGTLNQWEVRYNAARERFEGKLIVTGDQ